VVYGTSARKVRRIAAPLVAAALAATCGATMPRSAPPAWRSPGLVGGTGWSYVSTAADPEVAAGAAYLPGSSVLGLADGKVLLVPYGDDDAQVLDRDDPLVAAAVAADHSWLAAGTVPGGTEVQKDMASRALLDLKLLTAPNGASTASWSGQWNYVWPRDAAFTAAAFTVTGHYADASRILGFLSRIQHGDGLWAARYTSDGNAVTDGRRVQLDGLGWVLWSTWLLDRTDRSSAGDLWPMVRRAADKVSRLLSADGLPPRSSDYFERSPAAEQDPGKPTLGVVGPLLTGLRAAADLARERGDQTRANRWGAAANRMAKAVDREFKPYGYPRSPIKGGALDASATFLAPPYATYDPWVDAAVQKAGSRLKLPNGGVLPSEIWAGNHTEAWTPETAMFALAAAASGRTAEADSWITWLADHRTSLGALPEKVDDKGRQSSVAPLGWTDALTILTLHSMGVTIPVP